MKMLIDKLEQNKILEKQELMELLANRNADLDQYLFTKARNIREKYFGKDVYIRGLIEFSNYCKNDCYYCGIRRSNRNVERYRLSKEQILECCEIGYDLGFRTFVLQSGEDNFYTDEKMVDIISAIRKSYTDCAITLSFGEKSYDSYKKYFDAGANRYLLRHETATDEHYAKLHPESMLLSTRKQCLNDLKEIGFQVGCGFMIGSPFQTIENIAEDLLFIHELQPQMVGIGPFISHKDTPFKDEQNGSLELTLFILGLIRLILPNALIPATTALGSIDEIGRENGILAGANVVMPNLSPLEVRKKYLLYDNKICTGAEAAESRFCLNRSMEDIGYEIVVSRGDFRKE